MFQMLAAYVALHSFIAEAVPRKPVTSHYVIFHRIENPPGGVPAGYRAYRCHVPGYVVHGFIKSITKAEDGSEVLEPDGEYTSTPDPTKRVQSIVYIREHAVIPQEFLGPPDDARVSRLPGEN